MQPFTYMALITARDVEALKPFIVFTSGFVHDQFTGPTRRFFDEIMSAGVEPSYHASTPILRDSQLPPPLQASV